MKLVCLNAWEGKRFDALAQFISKMSQETDFFCFQEVSRAGYIKQENPHFRLNLLDDFSRLLPEFHFSFAPMLSANNFAKGFATNVSIGNAIFSKKKFEVIDEGNFYPFGFSYEFLEKDPHKVSMLQHMKLRIADKMLTLVNVHGIARWPKIDTPERMEQLRSIEHFLLKASAPVILCGDLNLFSNTESIKALGKNMKNLTEEFSILTTRSAIAREQFSAQIDKDTISDYVFMSPDIKVQSFIVPEMEISDHLPLVATFSL
ncbi:MAG: endonuclease/exonuclease/phosphatase family protein [Candidatus Paceibacterota bacterium]|jgi:endonuclease/exonuclease/phosphatase family metal-dependent hydrolase